jgi:hypothetical protein
VPASPPISPRLVCSGPLLPHRRRYRRVRGPRLAGLRGRRDRAADGGDDAGDLGPDASPDADAGDLADAAPDVAPDAAPDIGPDADATPDAGPDADAGPGFESACDDGLDDDGDGLRDCLDPDCCASAA